MMTIDEFRSAMTAASRDNSLCLLMHGDSEVIALGLDSRRGVAFVREQVGRVSIEDAFTLDPPMTFTVRQYEVPLSELREGFE